jgi:hypothetical protein
MVEDLPSCNAEEATDIYMRICCLHLQSRNTRVEARKYVIQDKALSKGRDK